MKHLLIAGLITMAIASCTGESTLLDSQPAPPVVPMAQVEAAGNQPVPEAVTGPTGNAAIAAALPSPAELAARGAARSTTWFDPDYNSVGGDDALLTSPGALNTIDGWQLISGAGELEWVIYAIPTGGLPVESYFANLTLTSGDYWLALPNFETNRWWIVRRDDSFDASITTGGTFDYTKDGITYLAVLSYDQSDVTIEVAYLNYWFGGFEEITLGIIGLNGDVEVAEIDGKLTLAVKRYIDVNNTQLEYWQTTSYPPAAATDFDIHVVKAFNKVFTNKVDLAEVAGRPAALIGTIDQMLYYAANTNTPAAGTDWTESTIHEVNSHSGTIAVNGDKPVVAFGSSLFAGQVRYSAAAESYPDEASDWDTHIMAFAPETAGDGFASIAYHNGIPNVIATVQSWDEHPVRFFQGESALPENPLDWRQSPVRLDAMPGYVNPFKSRKQPLAVLNGKLNTVMDMRDRFDPYLVRPARSDGVVESATDLLYSRVDDSGALVFYESMYRGSDLVVNNGRPVVVSLRNEGDTDLSLALHFGLHAQCSQPKDFITLSHTVTDAAELGACWGQEAQLYIGGHSAEFPEGIPVVVFIDRRFEPNGELKLLVPSIWGEPIL